MHNYGFDCGRIRTPHSLCSRCPRCPGRGPLLTGAGLRIPLLALLASRPIADISNPFASLIACASIDSEPAGDGVLTRSSNSHRPAVPSFFSVARSLLVRSLHALPARVLAVTEDQPAPMSAERKLTRGNSKWGRRKSVQHAQTAASIPLDTRTSRVSVDGPSEKGKERAQDEPETPVAPAMLRSPSQVSVSVVPERLEVLPTWYNPRELERAAMMAGQFRQRYPIHNPIGPRKYRNQHLVPPQRRQGSRPSSVFSPLFPPISAAHGDHPMHTVSMPGPSRTPSGSPLPTPSSSQVRLNELGIGGRPPRTRKVSQGAPHDEVDIMDNTDPWGTNWHHQSPYDVGIRPEGERSPVNGEHPPVSYTWRLGLAQILIIYFRTNALDLVATRSTGR
jgi:hypothetical protein